MFETFRTAIIYDFQSPNGVRLLTELAKRSEVAATALEGLTAAFNAAEPAAKMFSRSIGSVARSFGRLDEVADRSAMAIDGSMSTISTAAVTTAARVDASTTAMSAGFRDVAISARAAMASTSAFARSQSGSTARSLGGGAAAGGAASHGLTGGDALGIGGLAMFGGGVLEAAKTQNSATQLAIATGSRDPGATLAQYMPQALHASNVTAMSLSDAMSAIQVESTFVKNRKSLQDPGFQDSFARFADLMYLNPNGSAPFNESYAQGGRVSHMLGAYDQADMDPVLTSLYKARYSTPDKLKPMINQMAYYSELYSTIMRPKGSTGITQTQRQEIIDSAIIGDLTIGAGKWGNAYRTLGVNLLRPTDKQRAAQVTMGIRDSHGLSSAITDKDGNLDPMKFLRFLGHKGALQAGTPWATEVYSGFNMSAATIASVAGTDKSMRLYDQVKASQARMPDMVSAQIEAMSSLTNQTKLLTSNFRDLENMIGAPFMKPLTAAVTALASATGKAAVFLSQNPLAATAAGAGVGLLAVRGVGTILRMVGGVSLFARAAAHHSRETLGIVGHLHVPRGVAGSVLSHAPSAGSGIMRVGGCVGGLADGIFGALRGGIKGAFTLSGLRGMGGAFATFGRDLTALGGLTRELGLRAMISGGGLRMLGGSLLKVGLAALTGVGDLLLLQQGIQFLAKHSGDIGGAIGDAAGWIYARGKPMIVNAFKGLLGAVGSFLFSREGFMAVMGSLQSIPSGIFSATDKAIDGTIMSAIEHFKRQQPGHGPNYGRQPLKLPSSPPHHLTVPRVTSRKVAYNGPPTALHRDTYNVEVHPRSDEHFQQILESVHRQAKMGGVGTATHKSDSPAVGGTTAEVGIA